MQTVVVDEYYTDAVDKLLEQLKNTIKTQLQESFANSSFEETENALHSAFMVAERKTIEKALSQHDINVPVINVDGKAYRQIIRSEKTYTSAAGPVRIKRTLYRGKGETNTICPLDISTGMIEGQWTPRAAKQALYAVSQLTPYEAEGLFKELGMMQPSRSSLDRLPKKLGTQWESRREVFELSLSEKFDLPNEAVTVAVSLDGVKVPMQSGDVLPGDSRYEEASCGSISYYDKEGEPLGTRRYGRMPESKKLTMKSFLAKEIERALQHRPDLQLVKVADGAKDNWTFLEAELPQGIPVLDFYHAAEHLNNAMELIYGKESLKRYTEFVKYRHILRHDEQGIEKVIRYLQRRVNSNPKKMLLKTELNYFKNNKKRCRYAQLAEKKLPIGSGIVEATCKTLVTQRLKRSGMAWQTEGGQSILTFRALLQSHLFDEGWEMLSAVYKGKIDMPTNVVPFRKKAA